MADRHMLSEWNLVVVAIIWVDTTFRTGLVLQTVFLLLLS
jgi:hypothetical protein